MKVYSAKARLWYDLECRYFGQIFCYVTRTCDARDNDPTSNPTVVCAEFERLSRGEGSDFYVDKWAQQKRRFRQIIELRLSHDANSQREALQRIARATLADAAPVMLVIEVDASRLKPSPDGVKAGYPDNEEYVLDDIALEEVVQAHADCDCEKL